MKSAIHLFLLCCISFGCGNNETVSQSVSAEETKVIDESNIDPDVPSATETTETLDLCRCLTEPGNSQWAETNKEACDAAISKELGVADWGKVNFSKNPELNRKWDALVASCTGSSKVETGVEAIDKNNELVPEIGTAYGYIWEAVNNEAQLYTTLAFDGLVFRSTAYAMNGQTDSGNFTKIIDISGSWTAIDEQSAEGVIKLNNVPVSWTFSSDYSTLTNNKGVVFQRVKVK